MFWSLFWVFFFLFSVQLLTISTAKHTFDTHYKNNITEVKPGPCDFFPLFFCRIVIVGLFPWSIIEVFAISIIFDMIHPCEDVDSSLSMWWTPAPCTSGTAVCTSQAATRTAQSPPDTDLLADFSDSWLSPALRSHVGVEHQSRARAQGPTISCIEFSLLTCDSPHSPFDPHNMTPCLSGFCPPPTCICWCFLCTMWAVRAPPRRRVPFRCNIQPRACGSPLGCRWGERFWQYLGGEAAGRRGSAGCPSWCCGYCCRCGGTLPRCSSQVSSASTSSGFPTAPEERAGIIPEQMVDVWHNANERTHFFVDKAVQDGHQETLWRRQQWVTSQAIHIKTKSKINC